MLRAGNALRFTPDEIEEYRSLGLDFAGARTKDDIEQALGRWTRTLVDERPDLLDKIAVEMAKVRGVRLPPEQGVVARVATSSGCDGQS